MALIIIILKNIFFSNLVKYYHPSLTKKVIFWADIGQGMILYVSCNSESVSRQTQNIRKIAASVKILRMTTFFFNKF